ncbi:MAG: L-threonylcarbamoyladenylate synthase [Pseudomonadota bacterium]
MRAACLTFELVSQYFAIHPTNPQQRLIRRAAELIGTGGLAVLPTDTVYTLACRVGDPKAVAAVRRLRRLSDRHLLTLMCQDLSDLATYARVDNSHYRILKAYTPGPFTFILQATREMPRKLVHPKRKTVGIRVPDHPICQQLLDTLGEPLLVTTMQLPEDDEAITDPELARDRLMGRVDVIIDGGPCGFVHTTVVDLTEPVPEVLRPGLGEFP